MPLVHVKIKKKRRSKRPSLKRKPWAWLKWRLRRISGLQWGLAIAMGALPIWPFVLSGLYVSSLVSLFYGWYALFLLLACCSLLFWRSLRVPALIGLASVFLNYTPPFFQDLVLNRLPAGVTSQGHLTVVTRNWLESNKTYDGFLTWLRAQSPDVLAIQEIPPAFEDYYPEIKSAYPYSTEAGSARDLIILSRFPIQKTLAVPVGDHFALGVEVQTPSGPVRIYDLHPDTLIDAGRWANRNDYLEHVESAIDTGQIPTIVVGDLNATAWEPRLQRLKVELGLHEEPRLKPPTTRVLGRLGPLFYGAPIDHVYGNDLVKLSECRPIAQFGSDHRPLMCTANFGRKSSQ